MGRRPGNARERAPRAREPGIMYAPLTHDATQTYGSIVAATEYGTVGFASAFAPADHTATPGASLSRTGRAEREDGTGCHELQAIGARATEGPGRPPSASGGRRGRPGLSSALRRDEGGEGQVSGTGVRVGAEAPRAPSPTPARGCAPPVNAEARPRGCRRACPGRTAS
jgi:hypothetical protein